MATTHTREEAEKIRTEVMNDPDSPYNRRVRLIAEDGGKPNSRVHALARLKSDFTEEVEL